MKIYLDYNASTPIDQEVANEMIPYIQNYFGNPSSSHEFGFKARLAVDKARNQIAKLINCSPQEIVFTSGGTESNNYAIKGIAYANEHKGKHIVTTEIEHPAVLEVCKFLESKKGFEITYLSVDEYGIIDMEALKKSITSSTILISVMHANNETGSIQPIEEIAELASEKGIVFHTDAAQSIGKVAVDVKNMGVDLLTVAGHKIYAPKGVGALYIRNGVEVEKFMHGADHENNYRAGTENVIGLVGLGKACEIIDNNFDSIVSHQFNMREKLWNGLNAELSDVKLNGHPQKRLPNTLNISFKGLEANRIIDKLSGVAISAGAACHSSGINISHVLKAMKVSMEFAKGSLRISTGKYVSEDQIDKAINDVINVVKEMRCNK